MTDTDLLTAPSLAWRQCVCGAWYWGAPQSSEETAHSRTALASEGEGLDGRTLARAWNAHRSDVLLDHPDAQDCWPENCADDIAARLRSEA